MNLNWLGIIGFNGSGKSTVCAYLKTKGFTVISLSDIARNYAKELNLPQNRDNLTTLANTLKKKHGLDYFAKETVKKIIDSNITNVVFDSIRHPKEIKYLSKFNIRLIAINTPIESRYNRISNRKHTTDHVSFETFKKQDDYEKIGKSFGQNIGESLSLCHYNIINDGELQNLHQKIDQLLAKINP